MCLRVCVYQRTCLEAMTHGSVSFPLSSTCVKCRGERTVLISHFRDREAETGGRWWPVQGYSLSTSEAQLGLGLGSCFGTWSRILSTMSGVIQSNTSS